jgi:signal transduction histidine kinase
MASKVTEFTRVAVASRAFSLAAIVGLALGFGNSAVIGVTVAVLGIATVASYLSYVSAAPSHWVIAGEASIVSLVVVTALPDSVILLPYLVVLPLLTGLARGVAGAALVIVAQLAAILIAALIYGRLDELEGRVELLSPWALTIVAAGVLGASAKKLGKSPAGTSTDERYDSARRLLGQLRTLARRLPSGLDPVTIAAQMLDVAEVRSGYERSAIFARTEGGVFAPVAYRGSEARETMTPENRLISECWSTASARTSHASGPDEQLRHVVALPLRLGTDVVGALYMQGSAELPTTIVEYLQAELDELSLRFATALAFDEVRSLVTADERQRLAREIHDGVAQEVASLGYLLDDLAATASEPEVTTGLKQLRSDLSRVVTELRLSIFDLRTEIGDGPGLGTALSDYVRKVGARSSMTVHLTLDEAPTRLSPGVEAELFRIVQEAITNARKHSGAANLWVDCWVRPPSARIEVRDDGCGLKEGRSDSYGLRIMRERAERIAANVSFNQAHMADDRPGTCVRISIGIDEPATLKEMGAAS